MSAKEITVAGMGISQAVVATIVGAAAEKVEGVASIYGKDIASGLKALLQSKPQPSNNAVECSVTADDSLELTVHLAVFFGYPFTKLADEVRTAIAKAIDAQIGVSVAKIDVCFDELVFPKE